MAIVSEYASRTPAEEAFIAMLADYERGLPDAETLFDPARCPAAFLPYLAETYYADTYLDGLGEAYNRAAIASSGRINAIRGTWGAAALVCANAGALEPQAEYRRGPGMVVNAKLTAAGAGRIGNVHYGSLTPRNVKLPGGIGLLAFIIPASGLSITLRGTEDLDPAAFGEDRWALSISNMVTTQIPLTTATFPEGAYTISGPDITIAMRNARMGALQSLAGNGGTVEIALRPGAVAGSPTTWGARRRAWSYDSPLRNTGLNVTIYPGRGGQADAAYQQGMAFVLKRVLPYRITVNDVRLGTVFEIPVGKAALAPAGVIAYQGYEA